MFNFRTSGIIKDPPIIKNSELEIVNSSKFHVELFTICIDVAADLKWKEYVCECVN